MSIQKKSKDDKGKSKCPKCGSRDWSAAKTMVVKGILRMVSCTDCPGHFDHH